MVYPVIEKISVLASAEVIKGISCSRTSNSMVLFSLQSLRKEYLDKEINETELVGYPLFNTARHLLSNISKMSCGLQRKLLILSYKSCF